MKKMRFFPFALCLLWANSAQAQDDPALVSGDDFSGVILDGSELYMSYIGYDLADWEVTLAEIEALEAGLEAFLDGSSHPAAPELLENLADYVRQYGGIIHREEVRTADGTYMISNVQVVFANYFCSPAMFADWTEQPVSVDDGGSCFFQIEFDPTSSTYVLHVNGPG